MSYCLNKPKGIYIQDHTGDHHESYKRGCNGFRLWLKWKLGLYRDLLESLRLFWYCWVVEHHLCPQSFQCQAFPTRLVGLLLKRRLTVVSTLNPNHFLWRTLSGLPFGKGTMNRCPPAWNPLRAARLLLRLDTKSPHDPIGLFIR